jgi:ataxin-3
MQSDPNSSDVWIYHERQEARLCGQHALNNLAQAGNVFTAYQLSEIAHRLDDMELEVWAQNNEGGRNSKEYRARLEEGSHHVDAAGNFSIEVLKAALQQEYGLSLPHLSQQDVLSGKDITETQGFLCHKSDHWFAIRQIGGRFWNLNSTLERPEPISHFRLAKEMEAWQKQGYTIFCIPTGLPEGGIKLPTSHSHATWHRMSDLLKGKSTQADPWEKLHGAGMRLDGGSTATHTNLDGLTEDEMMQMALQASLMEPNTRTVTTDTDVPPEPPQGTPGAVRIQFRLPNNKRVVRRFLETDSVAAVCAFVQSECNGQLVELKYGFPPKPLTPEGQSIRDAGLANETLQGRFL